MVCDAAEVLYYKMQVYPGKDAALQEGTKPAKPVNNGRYQGGTDGRDLLVVVRFSRFLGQILGHTPKFEFLAGNSNF